MEPNSELILDPHTRSDLFAQLRKVRAQLHRVVAHSSPATRKTDDINTCPTYGLRMEHNLPGTIKMKAGDCMVCPACGGEYVHMVGDTEYIEGHDKSEAAPLMVRGDVLTIPMFGECGHNFVMCLGEHKGSMRVWFVVHPDELPGKSPEA